MKLLNPLVGRNLPAVTPVRLGGATGRVGEFGMTRVDPDGSPKMHKGVDLLCIEKWPVFAAHDGKVARAGWENEDNLKQGYGMRVWIVSLGGEMKTVYAHLSMILVPLGAIVQAGDLIGLTGRTGNITADVPTHLHFEVHVPDAVDPAPMLVT